MCAAIRVKILKNKVSRRNNRLLCTCFFLGKHAKCVRVNGQMESGKNVIGEECKMLHNMTNLFPIPFDLSSFNVNLCRFCFVLVLAVC